MSKKLKILKYIAKLFQLRFTETHESRMKEKLKLFCNEEE